MLLWSYLLCLLAATFVVAQSPEIRRDTEGTVDGDPGEDPSHAIRELLRAREPSACPYNYKMCPYGKSVLLFFSRPCFVIPPPRFSVRFAIYGRI